MVTCLMLHPRNEGNHFTVIVKDVVLPSRVDHFYIKAYILKVRVRELFYKFNRNHFHASISLRC